MKRKTAKFMATLLVLIMAIGIVPVQAQPNMEQWHTPSTGVGTFSGPSGWLVLTLQSTANNQGVSGAIFDVFTVAQVTPGIPSAPDMLVATLTTAGHGITEQIELPVGRYILVQRTSPSGFEPFENQIEIDILNAQVLNLLLLVNPTDGGGGTLPPTPNGTGLLLIIKRAAVTHEFLSGANFEIRTQLTDEYFGTVTTDARGEASLHLPPGLYYLRETSAPIGFILDESRHNFTIWEDRVTTVNRLNHRTGAGGDGGDGGDGRLLVIKTSAETGGFLAGAVFEVRDVMSEMLITTMTTNHFGEATVFLPEGNYFVREVVAPHGYTLNSQRISANVSEDTLTTVNVTNQRIPAPDEPDAPSTPDEPNVPGDNEYVQGEAGTGRLIVTNREDGGMARFIEGSAYNIYHAITNRQIGQITTNEFGDASALLPVGNYFVRQVSVPNPFHLNPERHNITISANALTEITVLNMLESDVAFGIAVGGNEGRLLVTKVAGDSGLPLAGASYEVRRLIDDAVVGHLVTDRHGEATISLMPGDYFIRLVTAPVGFVPSPERINFNITMGGITVVEDVGEPITGANDPSQGRLLVTVLGDDGARLSGVGLSIHHVMTDEHVGTLNTNAHGEAGMFLPIGNYFLRKTNVPHGYRHNPERVSFTVMPADLTDLIVIAVALPPGPAPEPIPDRETGTVEVITRAANSGNVLAGGHFGIYQVSDARLVATTYIGDDGIASFEVMPGLYFVRELRPTFGFVLETENMYVEVQQGQTVRIELTKNRDYNIPYTDIDPESIIILPETGQERQAWLYQGGMILLIISGLCLSWFVGMYVTQFARAKNLSFAAPVTAIREFSVKNAFASIKHGIKGRKQRKVRERIAQRRAKRTQGVDGES